MMTSRRPHDAGGSSFATRRGHANQLSISDSSHHITETIGTMYGDDDDYQDSDPRPMSFIAAPRGGEQLPERPELDLSPAEEHRLRLVRSTSSETGSLNGSFASRSQAQPSQVQNQRGLSRANSNASITSPISPGSTSPSLRDMRDGSEYPLTNIDNANDIAQELSNLQALRRMSMDVSNSSDPDLLPYQSMSLMAMPATAPKGDDDADPSRLLWVPAGVHPELAPSEFKNFVEKRMQSMKRRSSESSLSPDSLESDSGGLRRKKSMLSRQIETGSGHGADGYVDGAERLERRRSQKQSDHNAPELSLDELMKDPSKAVRKLTLKSQGGGDETSNSDDMPILPVAPGTGLRRSTHTTYRKGGSLRNRQGSLKNDERLPFSKRMASKRGEAADGNTEDPTSPPLDPPTGHSLVRVQSEPVLDNFSRPSKPIRRQPAFEKDPTNTYERPVQTDSPNQSRPVRPSGPKRMPSSESSRSYTPVPQIVETPPEAESAARSQDTSRPFPERSSSQRSAFQNISNQQPTAPSEPPTRSSKRPNYGQPLQVSSQPPASPIAQPKRSPNSPSQSFDEMAQVASSLAPGSASRTDTLTYIPTFSSSEEKRTEKKGKKDSSDSGSSRGTSWKWFKSDDKDKKKKDEDSRKSKAKALVEKAHDNVRLDVLQTSIDTALHKGRESLLLDRDSIDSKLEEERRKESSRKSGGEQKKERDGLFSSFFGSSKKRGDRDSGSRKPQSQRPPSPEPVAYRPLRPDVDYHWTRFPILEERAIYRMAHIKLANPRRALYSQVLLSNFMYAYLAKVQAMHPQMQVPQSPQQKRLQEEERRRREQEQQQYMEQQEAQDSIDRYNFEYHRSTNQYSDPSMQSGADDYSDSGDIYDYDHGKDDVDQDGGYEGDYSTAKDYYAYTSRNGQRHDKEEEMW